VIAGRSAPRRPPTRRLGPHPRALPAGAIAVAVAALTAGPATFARADDLPQLEFLAPLSVEGGAVLAPALGVAPANYVWGGLAAAGGAWSVGRAEYEEVFGRLVLGGVWTPSFFDRLSLGADFAALAVHAIRTVVPPSINEWAADFDVGELRVAFSGLPWAAELPDDEVQIGVRVHLRLTLPTDTSRGNEGRRAAPLRRVLGDDIRDHEFVGIDLGGTFAVRWNILTAYQTLCFVPVAVVDAKTQFLIASTTGLGAALGLGFELLLELNVLGRPTEAPAGAGRLGAVAISPGVHWRTGGLRLGLEARVGLVEDAAASYGDATLGLTARYDFDR